MATKGFLIKRSTGQFIRVGDVLVAVEEIRKGQVYLRVNAPGRMVERGETIDGDTPPTLGSQAEHGKNSQSAP